MRDSETDDADVIPGAVGERPRAVIQRDGGYVVVRDDEHFEVVPAWVGAAIRSHAEWSAGLHLRRAQQCSACHHVTCSRCGYVVPPNAESQFRSHVCAGGGAGGEREEPLDEAWSAVETALRGRPYPGTNEDGQWCLQLFGYPPPFAYAPDAETRYHVKAMPGIDSHHRNAIIEKGPTPVEALRRLLARLSVNEGGGAPVAPSDVQRLRIAYEAGRVAADFEDVLAQVNAVVTADTGEAAGRIRDLAARTEAEDR